MTTSAQEIRSRIIDALRTPGVAIAAGVVPATWASTTIPRVFSGDHGFLGARNRGRCPYIEVWVEGQAFDHRSTEGGDLTTQVRLRIHAAGRISRDALDEIMVASLAAIRVEVSDNYTALGDDRVDEVKPGPMGWMVDAIVGLSHSWDRTTYEGT